MEHLIKKLAEKKFEKRKKNIVFPENHDELINMIFDLEIRLIEKDLQLNFFKEQNISINNKQQLNPCVSELQNSERRYRELIDKASVGVAVYQNGVFVFVNKEGLRIIGAKSKKEIIGKAVLDFVHDDSKVAVVDRMNKVVAGQSLDAFEEKLVKLDGSIITAEVVSLSTIFNGKPAGEVVINDITSQKKVEAALQLSEDKYRNLIEFAPDAFFQGDGQGKLITINQKAIDYTGYSRDELLTINISDLFQKREMETNPLRYDLLKKRLSVQNERMLIRKDGSMFPIEMNSKKMPDGTYQSFFRDISDRKNAEKRLADERVLLRTLIDNLPDAIYAKDIEGRKLFANRVDLNNQGMTNEKQVIGKTDYEIFPYNLAAQFHSIDQEVIKSGRPIINKKEHYLFEKNDERWFLMSKFPLYNDQNEIFGLVGISRDITKQMKSEQKIVQLSKGVEQSPASIMITDLKGNIEYVNAKFVELTGYSSNEVIGKKPIIINSNKKSVKEYNQFWKNMNAGIEWKGELQNRRKNGELYWESIIISPIRDENGEIRNFMSISEDITEKKQFEQEVLKLNAGMNQSPASVIITSINGQIEYVNKKFLEITGYDLEELLGKIIRILKPGHSTIETFQQIWDNLKNGCEWKGEHLNHRKNGEHYWESVLISPIKNNDGETINFIIISEDISQRKKMEAELLAAKEKAEESDHLKSAFLNNMSHEIRTPLNSIVGFSELLTISEIAEGKSDFFCEIIRNSSDQLVGIISDIINISSIDAGQIKAIEKEMNVNNLLTSLFEQFKLSKKNNGVDLICISKLNNTEASILADEIKLTQIISNLIVNALKFTEKGKVEFGVMLKNQMLQFWVEDTGIGIANEMHDKIFERFRQADSSINKKFGGNGLGLSIAKSFVEIMNGEIGLSSTLGKGTRFYFNIPYKTTMPVETK